MPESSPANTTPSPEIVNLVQYIHLEKTYFWVPGFADDTMRAGLYGLDVAAYEAVRADFAAAARGAAEALLADESFARQVDRLAFERNAVVVVLGESDTDSLQSWMEAYAAVQMGPVPFVWRLAGYRGVQQSCRSEERGIPWLSVLDAEMPPAAH